MPQTRDVVVSGMRPTGRLHLGHLWGVLKNWAELAGRYECYFFVADWHMLTTGYKDTSKLKDNSRDMVLDWLAAGLDQEKCVIFKQSDVPEHAELALMLSMVTPIPLLENNPTWKDQLSELTDASDLKTIGFLGYPVLQAADIMLYRGTKVPVGQDQLPHVELSREIARRFNNVFGSILTEPQALLTPTPKVPGLDGRKMSKSYDNAVNIHETQESLKKKIMAAYTDPKKIRATDPGHPEPCEENPPGCSIFALHKLYASAEFVARRGDECRAGAVGCVACKKDLLAEMEPKFAEFREIREKFAAKPGLAQEILAEGAKKARAVAQKTMAEVRRAMRIS